MPLWLLRAVVAMTLVAPGAAWQETGAAGRQAAAQRPQDPPPQPPVFRTGTNLVRVDVTVTDRSGTPVTDLTAADFEVRENGQAQAITTFKLLETNGQPTDEYSLPIRSVEHAAAEAARDDVRVFVVFWDEYHIGEMGSAIHARGALTRFVLEAFGPTDLVALMDPLTTLDSIRFTRDRRALADQVRRLKGRRGIYVPPRSLVEENHLRDRQGVERSRAQVTSSALKAVVAHLGALREGRKAVLFVSEGLGPLGPDERHVVTDLLQTAGDNNTAIYTFDPRGLQIGRAGGSANLETLAYGTGARPHATNDMLVGLNRAVTRAGAVYLIGYTPADSPLDGRFRTISVRVKRKGLEVHARKGYWQRRAADLARARKDAEAARLPDDVARALQQLTPLNSRRAAEVWAGISPSADGRMAVTLTWSARKGPDGPLERASALEVEASMGTDLVHAGPVGEDGLTFECAPGLLRLAIVSKNEAGDIIDREQRSIAVANAASAALALSTPVLFRIRTPLELRELEAGQADPTATRDFSRPERLRLRVAPFGSLAGDAAVSATLLGSRGAELTDLPVVRRGAGPQHDIDIALASVAPGDFIVRIAAANGETRAEALVAFRVLR